MTDLSLVLSLIIDILMLIIVLQVKIEKLVTAMGGVLHAKASLDVNFVIVKNVLAGKYKASYFNFSLSFQNSMPYDLFLCQSCWNLIFWYILANKKTLKLIYQVALYNVI